MHDFLVFIRSDLPQTGGSLWRISPEERVVAISAFRKTFYSFFIKSVQKLSAVNAVEEEMRLRQDRLVWYLEEWRVCAFQGRFSRINDYIFARKETNDSFVFNSDVFPKLLSSPCRKLSDAVSIYALHKCRVNLSYAKSWELETIIWYCLSFQDLSKNISITFITRICRFFFYLCCCVCNYLISTRWRRSSSALFYFLNNLCFKNNHCIVCRARTVWLLPTMN